MLPFQSIYTYPVSCVYFNWSGLYRVSLVEHMYKEEMSTDELKLHCACDRLFQLLVVETALQLLPTHFDNEYAYDIQTFKQYKGE